MLKIKETRILGMSDLQGLCVKYEWFTQATNLEYGKFLNSVYGPDGQAANMTADRLLDLALEIQRYSDPETCDMELEGIVYLLCRACHSVFTVTEMEVR